MTNFLLTNSKCFFFQVKIMHRIYEEISGGLIRRMGYKL